MSVRPRPDTPASAPRFSVRDLFLALRPRQWTKNLVVPAAFFFAFWDRTLAVPLGFYDLLHVALATGIFCVVSSGVYVLNDIADIRADQAHPLKKHRPLAAGRISLTTAWVWAIALLAAGLAASLFLPPHVTDTVGAYVVTMVIYSFWLKHIALVDIMIIAAGFVLRAIAGAVAINVHISAWLLLCTFLLALFLALCKRRQEKEVVDEAPSGQRPSLEAYDTRLLDVLIATIAGCTILAYSLYTLSHETIDKFGTSALGFTIPFVVFGIFRYLDLVYRHRKGDRPEKVLLGDLPIFINITLYLISIIVIFLLRR